MPVPSDPIGSVLLIFHSIHRIMKAERVLMEAGLGGFRLIPTPRRLHSSCGLSIRADDEAVCRRIEERLAAAGIPVIEKHRRTESGFVLLAGHSQPGPSLQPPS